VVHQNFTRFDLVLDMQLGRGKREAEALEQPKRANIRAFEDGEELVYPVVLDKLADHCIDGCVREAATPIGARKLIRDSCVTVRPHRCLNITDEL
jgi:hypothetical protein